MMLGEMLGEMLDRLTGALCEALEFTKYFHLLSDKTLHVNFDIVWDENCIEFLYLSREIVLIPQNMG